MSNPLESDEDYVALKRFGYSLKQTLERYPDGLPTHLIAQALKMDEEEVEDRYEAIVAQLRELMKVDTK